MEIFLEWQSPQHHFDRKSNDWYWGLGIIVVGVAVLTFYFDDFLFGIFVIIAGITLGLLSYKETKSITIQVSTKGIVFGRQIYPWRSYQSFWIEDEHLHGARILMKPSSQYLPLTIIPVHEKIDLNDVREILLEFLDEEFLQESIVHRWFDKILAR